MVQAAFRFAAFAGFFTALGAGFFVVFTVFLVMWPSLVMPL
jgi:hypothetical protein